MEVLLTALSAIGIEAMKTWGLYVVVLIGLIWMLFASESRSKAKDEEIRTLQERNDRLQDLRLQDAREMIRVTEAGTATMASRAEGDARFRELMSELVQRLKDAVPTMSLRPPTGSA